MAEGGEQKKNITVGTCNFQIKIKVVNLLVTIEMVKGIIT